MGFESTQLNLEYLIAEHTLSIEALPCWQFLLFLAHHEIVEFP